MKYLISIAVLLSVALPLAAQTPRDDAMRMAQHYKQPTMQELPDPIALKESDVTGFISALGQLDDLDVLDQLEGQTDLDEITKALEANKEVVSILQKNGFSAERFPKVALSIGLAIATIDNEGNEDKMKQARAQQEQMLEQMKGQLTADQLKAVQAQMGLADDAMRKMENQPADNLKWVRKHRAALDQVMDDERAGR